ncbi:MAG: hypothetical protein JWM46_597 [Candidatus Kaiserbacteria bacterium]|nr:hypothetical protein [Candidatus Kaiserbacteria bacterium]
MSTFVTAPTTAAPCPVFVSMCVNYGPLKLYWYQVREVGTPLFTGEGWLVPIRYGPGTRYALLHYRFGEGAALRFDKLIEVAPNDGKAAWYLQNSSAMPRIISADQHSVVLEVYEEVETTDEEYAFHGSETKDVASKTTLFGILGPRKERRDTIEHA